MGNVEKYVTATHTMCRLRQLREDFGEVIIYNSRPVSGS
jgi:hypothetical protein